MLLDAFDGNRESGLPFYWADFLPDSQQRRFFDNPRWGSSPVRSAWPDGYLSWQARAYAVEGRGVDDLPRRRRALGLPLVRGSARPLGHPSDPADDPRLDA